MSLKQDTSAVRTARRHFSALLTADIALDLAERAGVLVLFAVFVHRMLPRLVNLVLIEIAHPEVILPAASINAQALLLVIAEGLGVLLILIRRRSASLSSQPFDWALSFSAVSAPLLLTTPAAANPYVPEVLPIALMLAGLLIQISGKAALWRSFGLVPANRGVKTHGLYRFVRHPIYAGYTLTHVGFLIGFPSLPNSLLYAAVLAIEIARLTREEGVLRRDPAYQAYAARVRYRLLPGVF
jgi:protein-S-isoprenylcysteine O-methyltransferase Ste14